MTLISKKAFLISKRKVFLVVVFVLRKTARIGHSHSLPKVKIEKRWARLVFKTHFSKILLM